MMRLALLLLLLPVALLGTACSSDDASPGAGPGATCMIGDEEVERGAEREVRDGDTCRRCVCQTSGEPRCVNITCPDASDVRTEDPEDTSDGTPEDASEETSGDTAQDTNPGQPLVPGPLPSGICPCRDDIEVTAGTLAAGVGLCGDTVINANYTGDRRQFDVVRDYFGIVGQRSNCLVVLSTGRADEVAETGSVFNPRGPQPGTDFNNTAPDPRPDGGGETVHDLAQLTVELRRPAEARGIEFDFMFLSAEWPEYLCNSFNDTFLTILDSEANPGGTPQNISFDSFDNEVSVNIGFLERPADWTVDLSATPFGVAPLQFGPSFPGFPSGDQCPVTSFRAGCTLPDYCRDGSNLNFNGSGTGWLRTQAPVSETEDTVRITFSIHDEGDGVYDSLVLLDGFRWLNYTPTIGTGKF